MKVCAFGNPHMMHKKMKHKGRHGCHHGMKACEGPFGQGMQGSCHFKKGKECKNDNPHPHGHGGHHGHKRHGPKRLFLHHHGLKHFGKHLQGPCRGDVQHGGPHHGHGGPHHGHDGPHHGHGGPHHGHGFPHHSHGGPHHGHGGPHHGLGGQHHGQGGPHHGNCGPQQGHGGHGKQHGHGKEHHGKQHHHGEKRREHPCPCFSQQTQPNPSEAFCCPERPKSV